MSETIYVVFGDCGEYTEREVWPVCAYHDKAKAESHAGLATEAAVEHVKERKRSKTHILSRYNQVRNPYDPDVIMGGDVAEYCVGDVEVREDVPNPIKKAEGES